MAIGALLSYWVVLRTGLAGTSPDRREGRSGEVPGLAAVQARLGRRLAEQRLTAAAWLT